MKKNYAKYYFITPFLVALYFPFALLVHNLGEIRFLEGIRAIFFSLLLILTIFLISKKLFKSKFLHTITNTVFLFLAYSYGHLQMFLDDFDSPFGELGEIEFLVPLFLLILVITFTLLKRHKGNLGKLNIGIQLIFISLIVFQLFNLIGKSYIQPDQKFNQQIYNDFLQHAVIPTVENLPDIYLIVLDGYSRDDALKTYFDYDNSNFIGSLSALGFSVDKCAMANYSWTLPSMTSLLNLNYLPKSPNENSLLYDDKELYSLLKNNALIEILKYSGYKTVTFESEFDWLNIYDSDIFVSSKDFQKESTIWLSSKLNEFEKLFLETTALRIIIDGKYFIGGIESQFFHSMEMHALRIIHTINSLPNVHSANPDFIYAHIISPHLPYVFYPNGELNRIPLTNQEAGYLDQTSFINAQILSVIDEINENNQSSKIIILMSDHGYPAIWDWKLGEEKLGVLRAIYGSDGFTSELNSHSQINLFRELLNQIFNTQYDLLPEESFFGNGLIKLTTSCEN